MDTFILLALLIIIVSLQIIFAPVSGSVAFDPAIMHPGSLIPNI
jgi:hypothetical protein